MEQHPFAHYLNEGASLAIDGFGTREFITVTEENKELVEAIRQSFNRMHDPSERDPD